MNKRELDRLLIRISDGDDSAFEQLYLGTRKGVFSFLYSYLGSYHDSEDAMQSVYLKIKLNIHRYTPGTNASAWILQIAKNQALNDLKQRSRRACVGLDQIPEEAVPFDDGALTDLIQRTLEEEERQIVILHVLWGKKHREIAELLQIPLGTVTSKYKRALQKLKNAMKEVNS